MKSIYKIFNLLFYNILYIDIVESYLLKILLYILTINYGSIFLLIRFYFFRFERLSIVENW